MKHGMSIVAIVHVVMCCENMLQAVLLDPKVRDFRAKIPRVKRERLEIGSLETHPSCDDNEQIGTGAARSFIDMKYDWTHR